jgi:hypothetical protein
MSYRDALVAAGFLFLTTSTANAQTPEMHETVREILEKSLPACYVYGTVKSTKTGLELEKPKIVAEYYIWDTLCKDLNGIQFDSNNIPDLPKYRVGESITVAFVYDHTWQYAYSTILYLPPVEYGVD